MMRTARKILLLTAVSVAAMGVNYVSAKIIPGYNRPYDPPNYYSTTSISWADTNKPSFFYIDLARQGMQVHDVPRDAKNKLSLQNTLEELHILIEQVKNKIQDMTGLSSEQSNVALKHITTIADKTADCFNAEDLPYESEQNLFRTVATTDDPRKNFNRADQYIWMDQFYADTLQTVKENLTDIEIRAAALNQAVENASEARGNLAANQSNTETVALYGMEIDRRNAMLSTYIALEAAHDMAEKDKALQSADIMKKGMTFKVSDPYRPAKTDQENYTRPDGLGFVDFK